MSITDYLEWYILYIPHDVYLWGVVAFLVVLFLFAIWKRFQGVRYALAFLLVEYIALLMYFTVFCRRATGIHEWKLIPLWSYRAIDQGITVLLHEVVMNVAVFVPIGVLLGQIFKDMVWWKVLIPGVCVSVIIELLQLILMRGLCETDDVLHNTLGCLIGIGIVQSTRKVITFC